MCSSFWKIAGVSAVLCVATLSSAKAEFVKISDDFSIHYETAGTGRQVILMVPGWTMSTAVFERQLQHFKDSTTYKVIAIDPRSQGLSTHTPGGNYYPQHGRDLAAFIDRLGLQKVDLAGWSNGAYDVLSYVHQFGPNNIRSLTLIDGTPKCAEVDNTKEWVWFRKDDSDGARKYFTTGVLDDRQKLNKEFAEWMIEKSTPEYLAWISNITNQTTDEVAALTNETCAYEDYSEDLKGLEGKLPLLFVVREEWRALATSWAKENTPSATIHVLGKHLMFWEHAKEFNGLLEDFLNHRK